MFKIKPFLAIYASVAIFTTFWTAVNLGILLAIAGAFLWLVVHFALKLVPALIWPQYVALFGLAIFLTTGSWYFGKDRQDNLWHQWFTQSNQTQNSAVDQYTAPQKDQIEENVILVEAETGTLKNKGYYSYIGESARGGEAYLGDANAQAVYAVPIDQAGEYTVWVRINDDGVHVDGARSATLSINSTQEFKYNHISKVRDDWEWESLGTATLVQGDNEFIFTKNETTSAAFVMDAFKLVPVE